MTDTKTVNDDYRKEIPSRMQYLFETTKWTDCQFLVGQEPIIETFDAHKLVLSLASPVFETMFHGALAEQGNAPIRIVDLEPDIFRKILQYMYTDKLSPNSIDVFKIYYGANKYMLPKIKKQCTEYLKTNIDLNNVFDLYDFATFNDEADLMQSCKNMITLYADELLNKPSFLEIKLSTFIMILEQQAMNISFELSLFRTLKAYAIKHGLVRRDHSSQENYRLLNLTETSADETGNQTAVMKLQTKEPTIDDALYRIRFLVIPVDDLANELAGTSLLSLSEIGAILMNCLTRSSGFPMPARFSVCRESRTRINKPVTSIRR
ncbi:BTB/POZ domain-containing protein 3-like isoform X2 [Malaya genurostris]|uniref:BTB/POZ domain-containing protein 3-like isoform X2 n=1 Tax=Malaya genurostris TaxID=325434 RepID=UPI0026F3B20E|nr:BTB/POZ domain-containing protein 3-like isoform X2 [Malaya genurostris]